MRPETAEELISRLNPKTQGWDIRVDGLTGGLSEMDIAHAMRGCNIYEQALIRYSLAGEIQYQSLVKEWLIAKAIKMNWREAKYEQKQAAANIVIIDEIISRRCSTCKGRRKVPENHRLIDCPDCMGLGRSLLRDKEKYQELQIDKKSWQRVWRARIENLAKSYRETERALIGRISIILG